MTDSVVVRVKPGSHKGPLVEVGPNGELIIYVREPAIDGKANDAVTRLLAAHLQLPKSRVKLVSGATSRFKRFRLGRGQISSRLRLSKVAVACSRGDGRYRLIGISVGCHGRTEHLREALADSASRNRVGIDSCHPRTRHHPGR